MAARGQALSVPTPGRRIATAAAGAGQVHPWPVLLPPVLAIVLAGLALPPGWQTLLAVALITLLGVPHGALDGELARPVLRPRFGRAWFAVFSLPYLALFAAILLAWRTAPVVTLAWFLAASVWHFGEEDAGPDPLDAIARGGLPVGLPVLLHSGATAHFLGTISLAPAAILPGWLVIASWAWCGIAALWLARAVRRRDRPGLTDALLVAALFAALPPLPAFTAYFVCLHAPRHMRALAASGHAPRVRTLAACLHRAVPLTILTFLIGAALWPLYPGAVPSRALALTLQVLAALTLPHMLLPTALGTLRAPFQTTA